MSDKAKLSPRVPAEMREDIERQVKETVEALAVEVEVFRMTAHEAGTEEARIALAGHLIEGHSPTDVVSLLMAAINVLADEQDEAGVALAKIADRVRAQEALASPEWGNGGYV